MNESKIEKLLLWNNFKKCVKKCEISKECFIKCKNIYEELIEENYKKYTEHKVEKKTS
jgi:hypothetical protein